MPGGWGAFSNLKSGAVAFKRTATRAAKDCSRANYNLAARILRKAKENAPVISGALRRSGRLEPQKVPKFEQTIWIVFGGKGTGVDYSVHVELGSSYQQGQFYLLRAVREFQGQIIGRNKEAFIKAWDYEVSKVNMMKYM